MTTISSGNIKRFLATAGLALALPLTVLANPGAPGDCGGGEGRGAPGRRAEMGRPGGAPGEMSHLPLRALNLSDAQRDKVFEIMHGQAPGLRDKAKAVQKAEEELHKLGAAPDYSEARARNLAESLGKAIAELSLARARADRQVFEVLTPEQRKQLADAKPGGEPPRNEPPRGPGGEGRMPPAR